MYLFDDVIKRPAKIIGTNIDRVHLKHFVPGIPDHPAGYLININIVTRITIILHFTDFNTVVCFLEYLMEFCFTLLQCLFRLPAFGNFPVQLIP